MAGKRALGPLGKGKRAIRALRAREAKRPY